MRSIADAIAFLSGSTIRLVVRIALRKYVPLSTCVQDPEHTFEDFAGGYRLASRTTIGNFLFRKMFPDSFPLFVCQTQCHDR
jgi:hypothetical protein